MSDVRIFAVAGRPVLHSRSPDLFRAGFRASGITAVYTRLAAREARDIKVLADSLELSGLNITSPFKEEIIPILDGLDPTARTIGAVNVVVRENGRLVGHNTDHLGAVNALRVRGVALRGRRALVLGAGGAARAAVFGLLLAGSRVTIVNRTASKAESIARRAGCAWVPWDRMDDAVRSSEIIVSCRSVPERPFDPRLFRRDHIVLDALYPESRLVEDADKFGCTVLSGRDWLLHQAAPGFELMTGFPCPVQALEQALAEESPLRSKKAIALVGFMGSGKSALGRLLARKTGRRHLDSDDLIESMTGLSIPDIFARSGEAEFRTIEKKVIGSLDFAPDEIVSLGGGAVLDPDNRAVIGAKALSFWIYADPRSVEDRIAPGSRPLLDGKSPADRAEVLFRSRISAYAGTADAVLVNDGRPQDLEAAAQRIEDEIRQSLHA